MMPSDKASGADNQQERLDPLWVVGFIDGEGCFSVSLIKNKTNRSGYQVFPEFVVTQGAKSLSVLEELRAFFNCGNIYVNRRHDNHQENVYRYCVRSLIHLDAVIVPFFNENKLKTAKRRDFEKLKKVVTLMRDGKHLASEGLKRIGNIASSMNHRKRRMSLKSSEAIRQIPT